MSIFYKKIFPRIILSTILITWSIFFILSPVNARQVIHSTITKIPVSAGYSKIPFELNQNTISTILEDRLIKLDYPESIRAGESDAVTLEFLMDEPSGQINHNESMQIISPSNSNYQDAYQDFNIFVEAKLEFQGMSIQPADLVSEPLLPGKNLKFYWNCVPSKSGNQDGTVWFYLRFVPKSGGIEQRKAIIAQQVKIKTISFYEISFDLIRIAGILGLLMSIYLAYPGLVSLRQKISSAGMK